MTDIENLKEHNESKLNIINQKAEVAEKNAEKDIEKIENIVDKFVSHDLRLIVEELAPLEVKEELPISNIKKESFKPLLERKNFNLSEKKVKGSMFKNFFCSLITGSMVGVGIFLGKMFQMGLIDFNNLQGSFTYENERKVFDALNQLIPANLDVGMDSSIILGVLSSLIFLILFFITEGKRKSKVKANQAKIYDEIEEYGHYIKNKLHTYADISAYVKRMESVITSLSVLFDEEKAKLRRINYMREPSEKLDLKTVKDITRVVNLLKQADELVSVNIAENGELSFEANNVLRETEEYIQKHIKKIYRSEEA